MLECLWLGKVLVLGWFVFVVVVLGLFRADTKFYT